MNRVSDARSLWLAKHVLPHEPAIRAWLQSRRLIGLEIDDIIQETYARLISVESVKHIRNPRSYAFQAAYSVLISHVRRSKVVNIVAVSDLSVLGAPAAEPSPEDHVSDRDELMRLAEIIAALPERVQAVFRLRRIEGLSQRDVAKRLGISENTVEKHMSRAFLLLLDLYGRGGKPRAGASKVVQPKTRRGHGAGVRSGD